MQNKLRVSFLCLPFLAGCSYFHSQDQKDFKTDAPPKQSVMQEKTALKDKTEHPAAKKTLAPQPEEQVEPEKVIAGNQPLHHISPLSPPDPTAMENNSNPSLPSNGTVTSTPTVKDDYAPALSARQQERQAAIKLRDSLERIQNGHLNNSEEDRQLAELPSSQRKAMLEQLNQALATK
ncbi:hypothetical protein FAI41_01080 [Acetobacteraceae bacterium]|nr:hypothetical protein FAI41_01080 [Acetobacteraceae bacterium]